MEEAMKAKELCNVNSSFQILNNSEKLQELNSENIVRIKTPLVSLI